MPDFARFLTRVREDLSRFRGSTDRLCAHRQMLHPLPRGQDAFMEAMREELAWHCLHFPSVAQLCWDAGCLPRKLLTYADLAHIPEYGEMPGGDEARERRRWDRVARNCLADLGWSRLRRAAYQEVPAELGSWGGRGRQPALATPGPGGAGACVQPLLARGFPAVGSRPGGGAPTRVSMRAGLALRRAVLFTRS
jgi:hypothetical protein